MVRSLGVVSPQKVGSTTWVWNSWLDGGAVAHNISTPSVNTTYTATFKKARAQLTTPASGSTLPGVSTVTFNWSAGSAGSAYWLYVGTTAGGKIIFPGSSTTALSATVGGIPTNGSTIYVRLWTLLSGSWVFNDYTYMAAGS